MIDLRNKDSKCDRFLKSTKAFPVLPREDGVFL